MEVGFTLIVKLSEWGLAKKCSGGYTREELVNFIASKWRGISKEEMVLSYDLRGSGEVYLRTMIQLLNEMQTRRVHVNVRRLVGANDQVCSGGVTYSAMGIVLYN